MSRIVGVLVDEEAFSGRIGGALLSLGKSSRKKGRRGMPRRPAAAGCIPPVNAIVWCLYYRFDFRNIRRGTGVFGRQDRV